MEAATQRGLTGDKATRIVEAMRESVGEVGITGSTFERVAARAGVSRGLLHYYFGSKERLLVEVIRRDTELRIAALDAELAEADSADRVIQTLFASFERTVSEEQGFVYLVTEAFIAGRRNPEIRRELGALYRRARAHIAGVLEAKEREGTLRLRYPAEAVVGYLIAAGDGAGLQMISDPDYDYSAFLRAGIEVAHFLLDGEAE